MNWDLVWNKNLQLPKVKKMNVIYDQSCESIATHVSESLGHTYTWLGTTKIDTEWMWSAMTMVRHNNSRHLDDRFRLSIDSQKKTLSQGRAKLRNMEWPVSVKQKGYVKQINGSLPGKEY